ncbi:MAG TPA: hypothetical protein VF114_07750 [Candidatus Limnocylindria bacterium]
MAGFVVGLIVAYAVTIGPLSRPAPDAGAPAAPNAVGQTALAQYQHTVSNLAAAVERHDWQSIARFKAQLETQIDAEAIQAIYVERSRLLANLAAAEQRGDVRMALAFRERLGELCPAANVRGAPAFCD